MNFLSCILCLLSLFSLASADERFLVINGPLSSNSAKLKPEFEEQFSPCSTFKIPLSLMGYDAEILIDEQTPVWEFQAGYDDFLDSWKESQSPQSWMLHSCVWYSKLLSCCLGLEKMQDYLAAFSYGNQDLSLELVMPGKADPAWFHSSPLKISLKEQVNFISQMLHHQLPITNQAVAKTKAILFKQELASGWKLFGKTGWSGSIGRNDATVLEYGWFIGWIEKENRYFPFAYLIREKKIRLNQRIPRVIELLNTLEHLIFNFNNDNLTLGTYLHFLIK